MSAESVILVDEHDNPCGTAEKLLAHQQGLLHRAFSVFVLCYEQEQWWLLLHQRQQHKYHCGGLWTNTCCSHPRPDETTQAAAVRRLQEEMGFTTEVTEIGSFSYRADFDNGLIEHEYDHVLIGLLDRDTEFTVNPEEVMASQWLSLAELDHQLASQPDQFTPWFQPALQLVHTHLNKG